MSKAARLLVLLEPGQHAALKRLSAATGAPMNYHVRQAVARYLAVPRRLALADDSRALLPAIKRKRRKS